MSPLLPGLNVSRETRVRLETFVALLERWNRSINLIARSSLPHVWERHVLDSAQLFPLRPRGACRWIDLGSGGGFPGLVVAILAVDHAPGLRMTLVESDHRKAAFLAAVIRETGVAARIEVTRVESLPPQSVDVLSARAFRPLAGLLPLCAKHLAPSGIALLPKGRSHQTEIDEALADWRFSVQKIPSRTDPHAVILRIEGVAHARSDASSDG